jgi:branched-chain amino acid transport system permease protein
MDSISTPSKKIYATGLLLCIAMLLLAFAPLYVQPYLLIFLSTIFMNIVLTLSWTIFSGPTRYISLCSAAFFGVGVYVSALVGETFAMPIVVIIGGLISFALAFCIGLLTLRLKGTYFIIFTFGVSELIKYSLLWWEANVTGTVGRWVFGVDNTMVYYVMLVIFGLTMLTAYLIKISKYGMALQSIGENEEASVHIGVNVVLLKTVSFAISAFFMGAAGAIMATRWTYIDPHIAFNTLFSFMPVLMAIFGGIGALYGPILGAGIFGVLEEVLITKFPYYYMLLFGVILIIMIMFLPNGLVGLIQKGVASIKNGRSDQSEG